MARVGTEILHVWDLSTGGVGDTPLTGLAATMSDTLTRTPDGGSTVSASETVVIAEDGTTGYYHVTYTPTLAQLYDLRVDESTLLLQQHFQDNVADALPVATSDNAYCSEADVIAYAQFATDFTETTLPTEAQVLLYMQSRAGDLYARLTDWLGDTAPGPSGFSTTIDTSSDVGLALSNLLRGINAKGAAIDALQAGGMSDRPARTERAAELMAEYESDLESLEPIAMAYGGEATYASNTVSVGEVSLGTITSREVGDLPLDDRTEF